MDQIGGKYTLTIKKIPDDKPENNIIEDDVKVGCDNCDDKNDKAQHWEFEIHNPNYYIYDALYMMLDNTNALKFIYQHIMKNGNEIIIGYIGFKNYILKSSIIKKFDTINVKIIRCTNPIISIEKCQYSADRLIRPRYKNINFKKPLYINFEPWQLDIIKNLDYNHVDKAVNWYHGDIDCHKKKMFGKVFGQTL